MKGNYNQAATEPELLAVNPTMAVFLGKVSCPTFQETSVPYVVSPDGFVGVLAGNLHDLAKDLEPNTVVWLQTDRPHYDRDAYTPPAEQKPEKAEFATGRIVIDFCRREVLIDGEDALFTPIEYKVMTFLAENNGKSMSREAIYEAGWGKGYVVRREPEHSSLTVFIRRMRAKLGQDLRYIIQTKRHHGYMFDDSPKRENDQ